MVPRSVHSRERRRRWRSRAPVLLMLALMACSIGAARTEAVSSSSVTVTSSVLSSTTLNTAACTGAATNLGPIQVSSTAITAADCTVGFGSSNDTSRFRLFQADQNGTALSQFNSAITTLQGAPVFRGVAVRSASEAWIVGYSTKPGDPSPISHTTDGGTTWTPQTTCAPSNWLTTAEHLAGTTVIAAGSGGLICRTTDAGTTWSTIAPPASPTWLSSTSFGGTNAWVAGTGGAIARSTDSGATWTSLAGFPATHLVYSLDAASATTIYGTVLDGSIPRNVYAIVSTDGGATWSSQLLGGTQSAGYAVTTVAISTTTAVIGSSYGTFRTTNSGATWTQVDATILQCVMAFNATTLVGYYAGQLLPRRSTDGGATWSDSSAAPTANGVINGCEAAPATSSGFFGGTNDQRGRTTDAGLTHQIAASTSADQNGMAAWTGDAFVSVGENGTIRRSIDGGVTIPEPASGTTATLYGVDTFGDDGAIAVGTGGTLLRSTNRGSTWTAIASGTAQTLRSVDRSPDGWIYAVGHAGTVIRSADDGATWTALSAPSASHLTDVVAISRDDAWVVGDGSVIYRTVNAGTTWTSQPSGFAFGLTSIDSLDGVNAIATTNFDGALQSRILRTTNGGTSWTSISTGTSEFTQSVQYLDPQSIVVGLNGTYRRSTDGGATWTAYTGPASIRGIAPLDANSFLFASSSNVLARVKPTDTFPDFSMGVNDFAGATGAFGACLHTATGTASTSWPVAGTGNCGSANLANWRGITNDSTLPAATIATTAASGSATLNLRFGAKPSPTQKPGVYTAKLQLEVLAP